MVQVLVLRSVRARHWRESWHPYPEPRHHDDRAAPGGSMKRAFSIFGHVALGLALSACASTSSAEFRAQQSAAFVVPEEYQNHTCPQLKEEAERALARMHEAETSTLEYAAVNYFAGWSAITIVGLPVAWAAVSVSPAFDASIRNNVQHTTLLKVAIKKNCTWSALHEWPRYRDWRKLSSWQM